MLNVITAYFLSPLPSSDAHFVGEGEDEDCGVHCVLELQVPVLLKAVLLLDVRLPLGSGARHCSYNVDTV